MERKSEPDRKKSAPEKNRQHSSNDKLKTKKITVTADNTAKNTAQSKRKVSRPKPSGKKQNNETEKKGTRTVNNTSQKKPKNNSSNNQNKSRQHPSKPQQKNKTVKPDEGTTAKLKTGKNAVKKRPMKQQEADDEADKYLRRNDSKEEEFDAPKPLDPPKKPVNPLAKQVKKIILAAVTIVILLVFCTALSFTVFFKIDDITVEGKTRYKTDEIITVSDIKLGDNLLLYNTAPAADNIKDHFAYIEDVEIEKRLFNSINIKVTEATPTSIVESDGKFIVLSKSGKIIEINNSKTHDVPTVLGAKLKNVKLSSTIKYKDENLKKYLDRIIDSISQNGLKDKIITVDISDTSHIVLLMKNGFRIIIGNFENTDYKIKTAAHILQTSVKSDSIGTLDVSLASSEGGKSYLKFGEYSTEEISKPAEKQTSKTEKKQESSKKPQESSETSETNEESSQTGSDGEEQTTPNDPEVTDEEPEDDTYTGDDETYDYTDEGTYDDGTYDDETYDDGTYDDGTYDDDTYDEGTYDDGTYDDDTYDDETYDDGVYDDDTYDYDTYDDYYDGGYDDTYDDQTYYYYDEE